MSFKCTYCGCLWLRLPVQRRFASIRLAKRLWKSLDKVGCAGPETSLTSAIDALLLSKMEDSVIHTTQMLLVGDLVSLVESKFIVDA